MKKDFKDNYLKRPYKILKDILEKKILHTQIH